MERKVISPIDIILILGIVVLGVIGLVYYKNHKVPGNVVTITVDGNEVFKRDIDTNDKLLIQVMDGVATEISESDIDDIKNSGSSDAAANSEEKSSGLNIIMIENGKVSVIDANCPDKICVEHKEIDSVGETIICLPHKLIVEIAGD